MQHNVMDGSVYWPFSFHFDIKNRWNLQEIPIDCWGTNWKATAQAALQHSKIPSDLVLIRMLHLAGINSRHSIAIMLRWSLPVTRVKVEFSFVIWVWVYQKMIKFIHPQTYLDMYFELMRICLNFVQISKFYSFNSSDKRWLQPKYLRLNLLL